MEMGGRAKRRDVAAVKDEDIGEETASAQHVVQVSRDRVVAPPARFLACSDEALLSQFQDLLCANLSDDQAADAQADQLAALFSLLEGVIQHEFLAMRRRLEADFAMFSAASRGKVSSTHVASKGSPKRLQRLSSIEEHERRFLRDFLAAMHSSHYKLLGTMEWEAAQSEAFLFTLPVEVEWGALDKRMLQRFWGDRPEQRAALPDLSDRILIFCRGFEPAKMRGRYLMHKVEMLLSFFLLAPLWAGLTRLLQKLGLKAPPPPLMARTPQKPEFTFKCAMKAAAAAVHWRRAVNGGMASEDSLTVAHDACTIIERKTMSRHFPTGRSVLSRFFDVIELQEACIRDVVVLYRRKVPKEGRVEGEKEVIREEETDPTLLARNIQIRQFKGIPLADLEMVMPEKKVFVPGSVFVQLVAAAVAAVIGLLATFWQSSLDWKMWGSALMLLGSRASQVYFQASSERNEIEREMNKLLFERTVASQEAVLHTLTDEMCRQHIRECFFCYCCLLLSGKDLTDDDLDVKCERLLRKHFGLRLDFTTEAATPPLCEWGLVRRTPDGRLRAQPLQAALVALDSVWDSAFDFSLGGLASQASAGSGGTHADSGGRGAGAGSSGSAAGTSKGRASGLGPAAGPLGAAAGMPLPGAEGGGWVGDWLHLKSIGRRQTSFTRRSSLSRRGSLSRRSGRAQGEAAGIGPEAPARSAAAGAAMSSVGAAAAAAVEASSTQQPAELDFLLRAVCEVEGEEEDSADSGPASEDGSAGKSWGQRGMGAVLQAAPTSEPACDAGAEQAALPADSNADGEPRLDADGTTEQLSDDAVSVAAKEEEEQAAGLAVVSEPDAEPASFLEASPEPFLAPLLKQPASLLLASLLEQPTCHLPPTGTAAGMVRRSSSSSSDGAWGKGRGSGSPSRLLRFPSAGSARITSQQLRHLESLRRQRAQQEAEALECLPSTLRLAEEERQQQQQQEAQQQQLQVGQEGGSAPEQCHAAGRRAVLRGVRPHSAGRAGSGRVRSPSGRRLSP